MSDAFDELDNKRPGPNKGKFKHPNVTCSDEEFNKLYQKMPVIEIAKHLNVHRISVRRKITELRKLGKLLNDRRPGLRAGAKIKRRKEMNETFKAAHHPHHIRRWPSTSHQ